MFIYLVTLKFNIAFGSCDVTPGQNPPGIPEEIVNASNLDLVLNCLSENAETGNRSYESQQLVEADNDSDLVQNLVAIFKHLPGFEILSSRCERPEQKDKPTQSYRVQCVFSSMENFDRLHKAFYAHIAEGHLVSNGLVKNQFVAFVGLNAVSAEGLERMAEALLSTAFGADSAETAGNFKPIRTVVL